MENLLEIKNLTVAFETDEDELVAVKGVSLSMKKGETLALVGESGCGKTVLCKAMLRILCEKGKIKDGEILLEHEDLARCSDKEIATKRGRDISMIFQDPMTSLNPTTCIGEQIAEVMRLHRGMSKDEACRETIILMEKLELSGAEKLYGLMPHHFSGGMRQRIAIAIALAAEPKLLLADEPTTALDVDTQKSILELLKREQVERQLSAIFITHDLSIVEDIADRVAIMKEGKIVEEGTVSDIFNHPKHPYTRQLLVYADYGKGRGHTHGAIHFHGGKVHSHHHGEKRHSHQRKGGMHRCNSAMMELNESEITESGEKHLTKIANRGVWHAEPLIEVRNLSKYYKQSNKNTVAVFKNVSFNVGRGEILGIIGATGTGKSTLARCLMGIELPSEGSIIYYNGDIGMDNRKFRNQIIFQDSSSAFNPRMTVEQIIGEPLLIKDRKKPKAEIVAALMKKVELSAELAIRYPYEISGGQRQRVAIARALSTNPEFIVADEPIASLDVSVQAQIIHLFKNLKEEMGMTLIIISHDLPMVQHISDRIIELRRGE